MKFIKQAFRLRLKEKRMHLPEGIKHYFATLITRQLTQSAIFKKARTIAFYSATFGEVPTDLIVEYALSHQKACYLPVLRENYLVFIQVDQHTLWHKNRFGILEPRYDEKKMILPHQLDLVVMPLVGFDVRGHRLGMGGGFYDRTFAFKRQAIKKPTLVGLAYDFQKVDNVPKSALDVLLDIVITEKQSYIF